MRFAVLGSGSRGNSVYIEAGATAILIDNGFSGKELARRLELLGRSLSQVSAICLTHEHNDHIGGVGVVSRRYRSAVYANPATFAAGDKKFGKLHKRVEFATGESFAIGDLHIHSYPVSHDAADPVGYVVASGGEYLGYCTDTGRVTRLMEVRLARCHGLILEFNHNREMLKNGPYPLPLQQRVRSSQGHLANEDGAGFLARLIHRDLKVAVLAHLSETNNTPQLAHAAALPCFAEHPHIELVLASQHQPTRLFSLSSIRP